jgi:ferredoxin-NADP reductase
VRELILRVASVRRETPLTRIVRLDLDGRRFRFRPGQAAMVGLADRPERVPYSIASAPHEVEQTGQLEFLMKVESSGRWGHLFDRIARGQRVAVDGPFGSFAFPARTGSRPLLFIAGGTGIAPVRSMITYALAREHGPIKLLYSAKASAELAYARELRHLARREDFDVRLHATREAPAAWRGIRSRITAAHIEPLLDGPSPLCFVCGPGAMVAEVPDILRRFGVPARNITLETWKS